MLKKGQTIVSHSPSKLQSYSTAQEEATMSLSILLAVLIGIATAQPERRCTETPPTWSGYVYAVRKDCSNNTMRIMRCFSID